MPSATSSSKSSSIAAGVARVEVAGRLVAEQQARRADQRAGDRHALLLAAGQLRRQEVGAVGDADPVERGERALAAALARPAAVDLRQHHVLEHRAVGEQVERLKDEAQRAPAQRARARPPSSSRDVDAVDQAAPAVGRSRQPTMFSSVDLPEPDGPDDRDRVAALDDEVDAAQRLHGRIGAVRAADAAQLDDRRPGQDGEPAGVARRRRRAAGTRVRCRAAAQAAPVTVHGRFPAPPVVVVRPAVGPRGAAGAGRRRGGRGRRRRRAVAGPLPAARSAAPRAGARRRARAGGRRPAPPSPSGPSRPSTRRPSR